MMGIWKDSDISSSDEKEQEEGIANLCLMPNVDEVYLENFYDFYFDELYEVFNNLMDKYKKIKLKNKNLKSSIYFWLKKKI